MGQGALEKAVAALRQGELELAERRCRAVLRRAPDHGDALQLLGLVLHRQGRPAEALEAMDASLDRDPDQPAVLANRALPLVAMGRLEQAGESRREALGRRPEFPEARLRLARVLQLLGDGDGAEREAREAASRPELAVAAAEVALDARRPRTAERILRQGLAKVGPESRGLVLLAAALRSQGRVEEAIRCARTALAVGRDAPSRVALIEALREAGRHDEALAAADGGEGADLVNAVGTVHQARGSHEEAEAAFRAALASAPDHAAARHNLGLALLARGRPEEAAAEHARVAVATGDPVAWIGFADAVGAAGPLPAALDDALRAALRVDGVDHQLLERAVRAALERDPAVAAALDGGPVDHLGDDPLLVGLLERTIVCDPRWEALLTRLRRRALLEGGLPAPLVRAVTVQATHTEHVWWAEADELSALPEAGEDVRGAYLETPDPEEERIREGIPTLALTDDAVSRAVRDQYEASPYPRLVGLHRKPPAPLPSVLAGVIGRPVDLPSPDGPLHILVAGCGTGQQALSAATRYAGAEVLAVDLSRRSLAHAVRLARRWGVSNIRFAQADLLALGGLVERFHLVEAGGVLHHLDDPMRGWRVLRGLLRPGGLMKIGLYSERARESVVAARALAAAEGWEPTADGIRRARRRLRALPEAHPARELLHSVDFYSASGFRDLVLHVCERRFTLDGIRRALQDLDLELLGFQHRDPRTPAAYAARFPDDPLRTDLRCWAAFEEEHPHTFGGMYAFWCRAP